MAEAATRPPTVRVSADQWAAYAQLARRLGVNRTELVRHAVEVYKLLHDQICQGAEVLICWPDGTIKQVRGI